MGFTVLEKEGFEADDILGTLSFMAHQSKDTEAYILTGDRDSLQLITEDGRVKVLLAGNAETTVMDEAKFKEKYGVSSTVFVDVKALMGDSSDNIPGVPGVGEKTALKLISEHGTLDGVYANIETAGHSPSLKNKLESGKDSAYLSRELARINLAVPLDTDLEGLKNDGFDRKKLAELFTKFGFSTLIKKYALDKDVNNAPAEVNYETVTAGADFMKYIDGDTVALCLEDGRISLFDGKKTVNIDADITAMASLIKKDGIRIITHDCKSLYKELEINGIHYRDTYHDIMLSAYVLNASTSHFDLERLALEYLGLSSLPENEKARVIYDIYRDISEKISSIGAEKLLNEIEMPLAAVLADMELVGFRIDTDGLKKYGEELDALAKDLEARIHFSAGCDFNISAPASFPTATIINFAISDLFTELFGLYVLSS